jgi:hypothetical protein
MANVITGNGSKGIAHSLYSTAVLSEVSLMKREGTFVSFAAIMARMPSYNQSILWEVLWDLSREGSLS